MGQTYSYCDVVSDHHLDYVYDDLVVQMIDVGEVNESSTCIPTCGSTSYVFENYVFLN